MPPRRRRSTPAARSSGTRSSAGWRSWSGKPPTVPYGGRPTVTPEQIEAARQRQEAEGIEPTSDPALLRRVAVLIAVWRQRRREAGDAAGNCRGPAPSHPAPGRQYRTITRRLYKHVTRSIRKRRLRLRPQAAGAAGAAVALLRHRSPDWRHDRQR